MIKKIIGYIKNPKLIILALASHHIFNWMGDKSYLKLMFSIIMNKKLDLSNPKTFNEKLQWLKLNDRKKDYTIMVDKYEAKKYVANAIGKEYIIPTLGVYENFDEINFDILPKQFVIKCTHDSGCVIICKDKVRLNIKKVRKKINKRLKYNYYKIWREWPYKNVKPRIIIEKYMQDKQNKELRDYKFFCFNGKVKCFKIDFNRFINHQANYYDKNANLLKFGEKVCPPDLNKKLTIPKKLDIMIKLAEKLSNKNPFVRIDFYEIEEKIYFGEITFYPAAGVGKFIPEEWDKKLGDWLKLPFNNKS